jgi:hypothetical protein
VSLLPPYNEHLVRDVGALSLAMTVLLGYAAVRPEPRTARLAVLAFAVYACRTRSSMPYTSRASQRPMP